MKHIFKNMRKYWAYVLVIGILLVVQAFMDFSLPDFTSKLIDTGISNDGVEYATPDKISQASYMGISMILISEEEKNAWNDNYSLDEDGVYVLKKGSDKAQLDKILTKPIAAFYAMSLMEGQSTGTEMIPDLATIRQMIDEKLSTYGDSIAKNYAIMFTRNEYKALGLDIDKMRSDYLWRTGRSMILFAIGMMAIAIAVGFLASKVGAGIGRDLRGKVFDKVVRFSDAEINHFSTASLITRTTNDVQQIQFVSMILLRMVLYAPIMAIGGIIMVARTKAGMGYIIGIAIAAILVLVIILMVLALPKFKIMQKLVDRVNLVSREILTGIPVIRAFSREKHEEERFDEANKNLTNVMLFTNRVMTFMMPVLMLIMNGISVSIVWIGAHKIDTGNMEIGTMTAFITYTMMIVMAFLMLTAVSIMLPRAGVAADRIAEVLSTEVSIVNKDNAVKPENMVGVVKFDHVDFAYPDAGEKVLSDIDFEARPGTITAIIGSTGCGKSSLINLIPRFFDVVNGSVTIDGIDVRDMDLATLRYNIGYVAQKAVLFSGTIASNIKYGQLEDSDELMVESAQIAQAESFITEKNEGYNSPIAQGGSNVSGGQKQRISIARAIARNPKIYIFDDSFSALDFKTDVALRKALGPKTSDSTVFIVAQRISTIMHADQILVLDDGKLVGKGTHKELMKDCDVYNQIAISQLSEKELAEV